MKERPSSTNVRVCMAKGCRAMILSGSWFCLSHWFLLLPGAESKLGGRQITLEQVEYAWLKALLTEAFASGRKAEILAFFKSRRNEAVSSMEDVIAWAGTTAS